MKIIRKRTTAIVLSLGLVLFSEAFSPLFAENPVAKVALAEFDLDGQRFSLASVPASAFPTGLRDDEITRVARGFYLGTTEVTYALWERVFDWAVDPARGEAKYDLPSKGWPGGIPLNAVEWWKNPPIGDARHPVTMIVWRDAVVWCNALTEWVNAKGGTNYACVYYADPAYARPLRASSSGQAVVATPGSCDLPYVKASSPGNIDMELCVGDGFRLPTFREWESASRRILDRNGDGDVLDEGEAYPGDRASGAVAGFGDAAATGAIAVYAANSGGISWPVASKAPNALGLHDMSGNVEEWCFDGDILGKRPWRAVAGGHWNVGADGLRPSAWYGPTSYYTVSWRGFRVARNNPFAPAPAVDRAAPIVGDWTVLWNDGKERYVAKEFGADGRYTERQKNFPGNPELETFREIRGFYWISGDSIRVRYTDRRDSIDGTPLEATDPWIIYSNNSVEPFKIISTDLYWGKYVCRRVGTGKGPDGVYDCLTMDWNKEGENVYRLRWFKDTITVDGSTIMLERRLSSGGETGPWSDPTQKSRATIAAPLDGKVKVTAVIEGTGFGLRDYGFLYGADYLVFDRPANVRK